MKLELENWGRDKQWVVVRPGEPAGGRNGSAGGGDGGGDSSASHHHIGARVAKDFGENGKSKIFYGRVIKYHPPERDNHGAMKSELFSVVYTDGDGEDFDLDELSDAMRYACDNPRT